MKLTFELIRDQHRRPVVLATLEGGWPTVEECCQRSRTYHNTEGEDDPDKTAPPYLGCNLRDLAATAAGKLLGVNRYLSPIDDIPNEDGALVFRGTILYR